MGVVVEFYFVEEWVVFECFILFFEVCDVVVVLYEIYVWNWVDEVIGLG